MTSFALKSPAVRTVVVNTASFTKGTRASLTRWITSSAGNTAVLTTADNLAFACIICNRHKGSDVASINPDTGQVVRLFHPRLDRWAEHFQISGEHIEPLTEVGSGTIRVLRLNAPERLAERRLLQGLGNYPSN